MRPEPAPRPTTTQRRTAMRLGRWLALVAILALAGCSRPKPAVETGGGEKTEAPAVTRSAAPVKPAAPAVTTAAPTVEPPTQLECESLGAEVESAAREASPEALR